MPKSFSKFTCLTYVIENIVSIEHIDAGLFENFETFHLHESLFTISIRHKAIENLSRPHPGVFSEQAMCDLHSALSGPTSGTIRCESSLSESTATVTGSSLIGY